jgi:hypothetical protein
MAQGHNSGGHDAAARALRALERGATTLGSHVARSVQERWARMPDERRAKLEALAPPRPDVSEIEVRDLRAELARELDRLAGADIEAARGPGKAAGDTPSADRHT